MRRSKPSFYLGIVIIYGVWLIYGAWLVSLRGGDMADKKGFKHFREWGDILIAAKRNNLENDKLPILLGMREQENGPAGYEYGYKPARGTDLDKQAGGAAFQIEKDYERYLQFLKDGVYLAPYARRAVVMGDTPYEGGLPVKRLEKAPDLIEFVGSYGGATGYGYAPVEGPEMTDKERELNSNWVPGVRKFTKRIEDYFKSKGVDESGT